MKGFPIRGVADAFASRRALCLLTVGVLVSAAVGVVWRQMFRAADRAAFVAAERGPGRPMPATVGRSGELANGMPPVVVLPPADRFDVSRLDVPTEEARRLVQGIWDRGGAGRAMTEEEVVKWRENWDRLLMTGAEAVPALAEYLRGDQDTFFTAEDSVQLGFRSAREAAIEALVRLGGAAATAVMGEALGMTASPREVALLASGLEAVAPGQYRSEVLAAVRESLEMGAEKQLGGLDVAPLFEVLQTYGGPEVAGDLERAAGRWGQYATMALAALPDEAGVPSLLRMADPESGTKPHGARLQALQVVAQLAGTNDAARAALVDQARSNQIEPYLWLYLARPLAGEQAHLQNAVLDGRSPVGDYSQADTVHIAGTNQNLVWARSEQGMSGEQFNRQASLVAELREATTSLEGRKVLDQARVLLEQQRAASDHGAQGPVIPDDATGLIQEQESPPAHDVQLPPPHAALEGKAE